MITLSVSSNTRIPSYHSNQKMDAPQRRNINFLFKPSPERNNNNKGWTNETAEREIVDKASINKVHRTTSTMGHQIGLCLILYHIFKSDDIVDSLPFTMDTSQHMWHTWLSSVTSCSSAHYGYSIRADNWFFSGVQHQWLSTIHVEQNGIWIMVYA